MTNFKNNPIRELARSFYWQSLYSRAKDLGSISLFNNTTDLSEIQIIFLQWLEIYNSLYSDLYIKEKYISEEVIQDQLRCDAYLLWKKTERDKERKEKPSNLSKKVSIDGYKGIPTVNFE